jgi:hypothetical protein
MTNNQVSLEDLPEVVAGFLRAHQARNLDVALQSFSADATVVDDGKTYKGLQRIRSWMSSSTNEFTYTTEPVAAYPLGDDHYEVVQHPEGNFPGGVVDLHFRFALREGTVLNLLIAP